MTYSWQHGTYPLLLALAAVIVTVSPIGIASDTDQPIEITADSVVREEPSGKTRYSGQVVLKQGSLEINADSLVFFFDESNASVVLANGEPATLEQRPEGSDTTVNAEAKTIDYREANDRIRLLGDARVLQNGAVIEGNTIEYIVSTQRVMAAGAGAATGDSSQRVKVIIPPNSLRDGAKRD